MNLKQLNAKQIFMQQNQTNKVTIIIRLKKRVQN